MKTNAKGHIESAKRMLMGDRWRVKNAVLCILSVFLIWPSLACAAGVQALFDLDTPAGGPFPSDRFTVADRSHNTGRRVNLPLPDCGARPSDCEDLNVINTLDGFNLQPRLSIPFDGPIDVGTVTRETVFLISLGSTRPHGDRGGRVIGINQVVWDPGTLTLHAESDKFLDQHTRYALIVTRGMRDASGDPVEATEAFRRFRQTVRGDYRRALLEAVQVARRAGIHERDMVTASVFTTQSVTAILEKIRDRIKADTPEPADFLLGPDQTRTVFALDEVKSITFNQHRTLSPPTFQAAGLNLDLLRIIPEAVGTIAFGKYASPDYQVHPGEFIPPVATRTGIPEVRRWNDIYFNLFLPSGPKPAGGWPVAIYLHSSISHKQNMNTLSIPAMMASRGLATIAINQVGHGFGPLGTLTVDRVDGKSVTFLAGGRGIDQNDDNIIGAEEGIAATAPQTIIQWRDGERQAAVDLLQLVRVIEAGMDGDGDGSADLDPARIYFAGYSSGGRGGTMVLALDPSVRAGVFIVNAGPLIENRLSPRRPRFPGEWLSSRTPSLINSPGVTRIAGGLTGEPFFNENMPLRDGIPFTVELADGRRHEIQSPVINTAPGAMAIQELFERTEWVEQAGSPVGYTPHLRKAPLPGMPAKPVIYQIIRGDNLAIGPVCMTIIRAGDLADRVSFLRYDRVFAENPEVPRNAHNFIHQVLNPTVAAVALGAQEQIAVFFASDGAEMIRPTPTRFWEAPIMLPLPEDLFFIPRLTN